MNQLKVFLVVGGIAFSAPVLGQYPIVLGEYEIGDCKINVRQQNSGWYVIRVDQGTHFAEFKLSLKDGQLVGGINSCNGQEPNPPLPTAYDKIEVPGFESYIASCGGLDHSVDHSLQVVLDKTTHKVRYLFVNLQLAKWSTPDGRHSGRNKSPPETMICSLPGDQDLGLPLFADRKKIEAYLAGGEQQI